MCETIFSNFLGAFFGFLFAILIEILVERNSSRDMQKKVKNSISDELEQIRKSLVDIKDKGSNPVYFRYQYIAWKTCINSGYLFSVSGKPIYNQFIKVYTDIEFADDLEQRYFEILTMSEKKDSEITRGVLNHLNLERKERREDILHEIEEILEL